MTHDKTTRHGEQDARASAHKRHAHANTFTTHKQKHTKPRSKTVLEFHLATQTQDVLRRKEAVQ